MATTPVIAAIQRAASAKGIDWRPLAAVAHYESGLNPRALGDGGHAFGLFQNNNAGGTITGDPNPTRFFDPNVAATYAANAVSKLGLAGMSPAAQVAAIVNRYERPAKPLPEIAGAQSFLKTLGVSAPPRVSLGQTVAAPAAPSVATPSSPTTGPDLSFLQAGLAQAQGAQQRAFDALAKVSGGPARAAAPALDLGNLLANSHPTTVDPTRSPTLTGVHGDGTQTVDLRHPAAVQQAQSGSGAQAAKAVALARSLIGTPYRFGGNDPKTGIDCSRLIQLVWERNGVSLPRVASDQARVGKTIPLSQVQPGDGIFMATEGGDHISHVMMAIGGGKAIEAPHTGDVVKIVPINQYVSSHTVVAKRFA